MCYTEDDDEQFKNLGTLKNNAKKIRFQVSTLASIASTGVETVFSRKRGRPLLKKVSTITKNGFGGIVTIIVNLQEVKSE